MRNALIRILQALVIVAVASSFAHAFDFVHLKKKAAAGGGTCSPSPTGDELTDGFENLSGSSGYEANTGTWTQTGSTIDNQVALTSDPTNSCSKGINFNVSNSVTYSKWDRGSPIDNTTRLIFSGEFIINSISIGNFTSMRAMVWGDTSASNALALVQIGNDASQIQVRCSNIGDLDASTWVNISTGTWYRITVDIDNSGGPDASTCKLDTWNGSSWSEGSANTWTRPKISGKQYLSIGGVFGIGSGETIDITFGYVYVSTP